MNTQLTTEEQYVVRGYWAERSNALKDISAKNPYPYINNKNQYNAIAYCEAFIVRDYTKTLDILNRYCNVFRVNKKDILEHILNRAELAKKIGDQYAPDIEKLHSVINRYLVEKQIKEIELEEEIKVLQNKYGEFLGPALVIMDELAIERKKIADDMYQYILNKIYASPIDIIFKSGKAHFELKSRYNTIGELVVDSREKLKSMRIPNSIVSGIKTKLKSCGLYFVSDLNIESWLRVAKDCSNCWRVQHNVRFFDTKKSRWDPIDRELNSSEHCKKDNCNWSLWEESHQSSSSFFKEITDKFLECASVREKMSMVQDLSNKCYGIWNKIQRCEVESWKL